MEYKEFSAKTVNDAITEACTHFIVTSSSLEYEVIEEGSTGFLGIGSKPAVIKARVKSEEVEEAKSVFTQEAKEEKPEKKEVKKEVKDTKKEFKANNEKANNEVKEAVKEEAPKKRELEKDV